MACNACSPWWLLVAPWVRKPCLQILQVAVLNLGTFLCQHLKLDVCALPQITLATPSRSASPIDQFV